MKLIYKYFEPENDYDNYLRGFSRQKSPPSGWLLVARLKDSQFSRKTLKGFNGAYKVLTTKAKLPVGGEPGWESYKKPAKQFCQCEASTEGTWLNPNFQINDAYFGYTGGQDVSRG